MELKSILKLVELFHGLDDSQLDSVASISTEKTFGNKDLVFEQGSIGDALYIISEGQVEVQVETSKGKSYAAIYLGKGQVFGEMALVDKGPRSASIVAVEDGTKLFCIGTQDFNDLCKSNTDIGYVMMRNIAQDLSFKLRHWDFNPSSS